MDFVETINRTYYVLYVVWDKVKFVMGNNDIGDRRKSNALGSATGWLVVLSTD